MGFQQGRIRVEHVPTVVMEATSGRKLTISRGTRFVVRADVLRRGGDVRKRLARREPEAEQSRLERNR